MHPSIASTLTKSAPAFLLPKCRCLFCSLHMLCDRYFSLCIEFLTLFFLFFLFQFCQAKEEQNAICNRAVTIEKRLLMPASTLTFNSVMRLRALTILFFFFL
ncbi:hypothetical protein BHM03_00005743 [Ensete ventricosum]|nr:hypothetical protein BHM03_00005743 [Ensete ventricosum]